MNYLSVFRNCARRSLWFRVTCKQPLSANRTNQWIIETSKSYVTLKTERHLSSMNPNDFIATSLIDSVTFEQVCSETLESLCDYFEYLVEESNFLKSADITYGDGVLTVNLGEPYGTYVINRQSPNRQIWLSSPTSGPKRYDFIPDKSTVSKGYWVYKHDGMSLHELLQKEIREIVKKEVDFLSLPHSKQEV